MKIDELTKIFKALSDNNRVRILKMLELKPLCVCEIKSILGIATSTTSKHLSILREAGLIFDQKDNKWVNYHLNRASRNIVIRAMLPLLTNWMNDERVITIDREKVKSTDRINLCKL